MPLVPPTNARPPREAHRLDEAALGRWLAENVHGCAGGTARVLQFKGGQSNPTYWVGVEGGEGGDVELALRKKPPGKLLPSAHAIEREYRVMRALRGSEVPVPEALALCEDDTVVGTPFFVMRYVPGRIFWQATLPELATNEERRAVYDEYVRVLAALHRVDFTAVGLADYGRVGGFVARQVDRWSKQYEASRTGEVRAMDALIRWLAANVPARDETTLVHGDYRLDNLIFSPSGAPRAVATLDWELSTLGHPLSDLAYACMGYRLNLPGRGGLAGIDVASLGMPSEEELVAAYCRLTGRAGVEDWPYYMAFGIFRIAAIVQGVYKRSLQGNASSDDAASYGAAVGMLSELACSIAGVATT
jgi:aminoglycoside phosphotransferase (APT) family kinase protein